MLAINSDAFIYKLSKMRPMQKPTTRLPICDLRSQAEYHGHEWMQNTRLVLFLDLLQTEKAGHLHPLQITTQSNHS